MIDFNEIGDDEIRIIGEGGNKKPKCHTVWVVTLIVAILAIAGVIVVFCISRGKTVEEEPEQGYFEPVEPVVETVPTPQKRLSTREDSLSKGFTEIIDTAVNDIPLRIYIPHNAEMTLHVGRLDINDTTIVYAAQAADIRRDNHGIVGAFVLKGTPLSWGLSKKGYCACIDGKVTIGVSENSPLFEEATEKEGYFFRQYPLVSNGRLVESGPKGKSIRRAICERLGEIFIAETETLESFHDFSQALVDLGVAQAVYLVGSSFPFGRAIDENGICHEFGDDYYYRNHRRVPHNINYIVWRMK